jgi:hypothetical protein
MWIRDLAGLRVPSFSSEQANSQILHPMHFSGFPVRNLLVSSFFVEAIGSSLVLAALFGL